MTRRRSQKSTTFGLWPHQVVIDHTTALDHEKTMAVQVAGYRLVRIVGQAFSFSWVYAIADAIRLFRNPTDRELFISKMTTWSKSS